MFFLIWWVVLFAVLPWGVHSQQEGGEITPGTDPGAPLLPRLGRKLLWTTLVTAVIFTAIYVASVDSSLTFGKLFAPAGMEGTQLHNNSK
jgi:predicted secreted protein